MRNSSWLRAGLGILSVLLCLPAHAVELPDGDWIRLEFEKLTVLANVKAKDAAGYARQLLLLDGLLDPYAPSELARTRRRVLYLFDDSEDYTAVLPVRNGQPARMAGYTVQGLDTVYLTVDLSASVDPMEIVYHEYVHARLAESVPQAPLWVHEGLAEFYSYLRFENEHLLIGKPIRIYQAIVRNNRLLDEGGLLLTKHGDPNYNESNRQTRFYAQSWGSVHYLLSDKERRLAFANYLRDLRAGARPWVAFEKSLGAHFPRQRTELKEYLAQSRLPFFRLPLKGRNDADYEEVELSDTELHSFFGELLTLADESLLKTARAHFESALKADPEQTRARIGIATIEFRQGERDAAIQRLRSTLAEDEGHPAALRYLGFLLLDEYESALDESMPEIRTETPAVLSEARSLFASSLRIEPDNPDALAGLGASYMADADPAAGIESLRRAITRSPWQLEYIGYLFQLLCNGERAEEAREVLESKLKPLFNLGDEFYHESAVVSLEIARARELHEAGERTGAALLLVQSSRQTNDWRLREQIAETWELLGFGERLDTLREIVELVRTQDFEAAEHVLDTLESFRDDDRLAEFVESIRVEIKAHLAARESE